MGPVGSPPFRAACPRTVQPPAIQSGRTICTEQVAPTRRHRGATIASRVMAVSGVAPQKAWSPPEMEQRPAPMRAQPSWWIPPVMQDQRKEWPEPVGR